MHEPQQSAAIPEAALIARLRRRDTEALEILMQRHAARVYRVAFGITRNDADAEEVVQDVFLSLFEKIAAFEERAALGTWLYRVATNSALLRRRGKRLELLLQLPVPAGRSAPCDHGALRVLPRGGRRCGRLHRSRDRARNARLVAAGAGGGVSWHAAAPGCARPR